MIRTKHTRETARSAKQARKAIAKNACPLRAGYCAEHGFHHGAEAEELRQGVETLIEHADSVADYADGDTPVVTIEALRKLLDRVDARDALAFVEGQDGVRRVKKGAGR